MNLWKLSWDAAKAALPVIYFLWGYSLRGYFRPRPEDERELEPEREELRLLLLRELLLPLLRELALLRREPPPELRLALRELELPDLPLLRLLRLP